MKNTLLKLALKEAGLEGLDDVLTGTTAIAIHQEDPIVAAKILGEFADKSKTFELKARYMDGKALNACGSLPLWGKLPVERTAHRPARFGGSLLRCVVSLLRLTQSLKKKVLNGTPPVFETKQSNNVA